MRDIHKEKKIKLDPYTIHKNKFQIDKAQGVKKKT